MAPFYIGWSEQDITPESPVSLAGQYYPRISQGIHSPLFATVLAIQSGDSHVIMVSLDLLGIEVDFQKQLCLDLARVLPEINPQNLILNAIHTHNAPALSSRPFPGHQEFSGILSVAEYRAFLLKQIKKAIVEAWKKREPGSIASAFGFARIGHCRRVLYADSSAEMYGCTARPDFVGMEGSEDSGVEMLFTFNAENRPVGLICNVACPSQVMEATYWISSDFMGETRKRLKEHFGRDFHTLFQVGAAGDQSPRDLTRLFSKEPNFWQEEGVVALGERLFFAVTRAFSDLSEPVSSTPDMRHIVKVLSLPRRRASNTEYLSAKETVSDILRQSSEEELYQSFCEEVLRNEKITGRQGPYDRKGHPFVLFRNARAVIERFSDQDHHPFFSMELHLLRLGSMVFVTNPFELFFEFGQRIRARSAAKQTCIVQLCGGAGGYLPTATAEKAGGYGGLIVNGQVGSEGGALLVEESLSAIETVWRGNP